MSAFKIEWGKANYINKKRNIEIAKTVIMFLIAFLIYYIAYTILKTNKSIWTILAVLTVLPASKCAVSMVMFLRFSSIHKDELDAINKENVKDTVIYDLIFTTTERSYLVKACAVIDNTIIMYADYDDKAIKKLTSHLKLCLERDYIKGYSLKIFPDLKSFVNRLGEMNNNLSDDLESIKPVRNLFKSITL